MSGLLASLTARGSGANSAEQSGIFGIISKFDRALAQGTESAAESLRLQLAMLAELRAMNATLERLERITAQCLDRSPRLPDLVNEVSRPL